MSTSTSSARQHWGFYPSTAASTATLTPSTIRFQARQAVLPRRDPREVAKDSPRRLLNIAVATVGIVLTAPLMLVIALAVRLTSPGPVIYKQARVGVNRRDDRGPDAASHRRKSDLGGRIFTIYKFRTMYVDGTSSRQVWATENDPRITPIGRALRASRLDELPQLFNVLLGDMNIVGPRPEQPEIFQHLRDELGRYGDRQRVLPGITGLAQVSLPYDQSLDDVRRKIDLDLEYIRRRSAAQDLVIMAKTMPVMVLRKGSQ